MIAAARRACADFAPVGKANMRKWVIPILTVTTTTTAARAQDVAGYTYSDAIKSAGIVCGETTFKEFMTNPSAKVPGTKMLVSIGDEKEVASLWAGASEPAAYCADLKHIANLAMTRERLSSIIGKPREGNFRDTSLPLKGWNDCSFYGAATYTCDSRRLKSEEMAAKAQEAIARQIIACLDTWDVAQEQSSSANFIVLHPRLGPASITLNLDQSNDGQYVVRLILFLRR